jgi:hypothetical protein
MTERKDEKKGGFKAPFFLSETQKGSKSLDGASIAYVDRGLGRGVEP